MREKRDREVKEDAGVAEVNYREKGTMSRSERGGDMSHSRKRQL